MLALFVGAFGTQVVVCAYGACHDLRDWNEALEPFKTVVITAVGSVIGYFFARRKDS